jgi:hypothetical protein
LSILIYTYLYLLICSFPTILPACFICVGWLRCVFVFDSCFELLEGWAGVDVRC